jgi:hypothetical protein
MSRAIAALLAAAALAGCSREEEPALPASCLLGPDEVRSALAAAPGRVRVEGTRVSECVSQASDSSDIQTVGATYLAVAGELMPQARAEPESAEARQLGYLVGAVRKGSGRTQGYNLEMVRRLEQEVAAVEARSAAFAEGERAGRETG